MARRLAVLSFLVGLVWFVQPVLAASKPARAEIDPRVWQEFSAANSIHIIVRVRDLPALPSALSAMDLLKNSALRQVEQRIQAAENSQRRAQAALAIFCGLNSLFHLAQRAVF